MPPVPTNESRLTPAHWRPASSGRPLKHSRGAVRCLYPKLHDHGALGMPLEHGRSLTNAALAGARMAPQAVRRYLTRRHRGPSPGWRSGPASVSTGWPASTTQNSRRPLNSALPLAYWRRPRLYSLWDWHHTYQGLSHPSSPALNRTVRAVVSGRLAFHRCLSLVGCSACIQLRRTRFAGPRGPTSPDILGHAWVARRLTTEVGVCAIATHSCCLCEMDYGAGSRPGASSWCQV